MLTCITICCFPRRAKEGNSSYLLRADVFRAGNAAAVRFVRRRGTRTLFVHANRTGVLDSLLEDDRVLAVLDQGSGTRSAVGTLVVVLVERRTLCLLQIPGASSKSGCRRTTSLELSSGSTGRRGNQINADPGSIRAMLREMLGSSANKRKTRPFGHSRTCRHPRSRRDRRLPSFPRRMSRHEDWSSSSSRRSSIIDGRILSCRPWLTSTAVGSSARSRSSSGCMVFRWMLNSMGAR